MYNLFFCKSEDGKPIAWREGEEVWMEKVGEDGVVKETVLFKVVAIKGLEAILQELPSGSA